MNGGSAEASRCKGFTLMEMMLVLALAVAALAIVVPNLSGSRTGAALKGAAQDVASALRYVRGRAITAGGDTEFVLDVESRTYRVSGREKTFVLPNELQITLDSAESEIRSEGVGAIRFFPDGSSTGGRVTLAAGNRKRIVDVNWLTGLVETREE